MAFGTAVILLLASGVATYATVVRLRSAERWVGHTRDVQSSLAEISNVSARAGRARARYVDTGSPSFLEEYQSAAGEIPNKLQLVEQLLSDNPEQLDLLKHLEAITNHRLDLLNKSVRLELSASGDVREQARLRQQTIEASAEADSLLQKMQGNEQELLDTRRMQSERLFRVTAYILCAAFAVTLLLFLFHYRILNAELNAREQAEASLRSLSVRLLELQDQERRKFSRELHDSLGQYLVGVKMNLTMLGNSVTANTLVSESIKLLDLAMTETRTISHLLHPPLLDETGFASAARWYVEGFAKRSGIQTSLEMPEDLVRLPSSIELALFRVLQETLTNVHRHSKSQKADVSLKVSEDTVVLRIRDYGKGIPPDVLGRFRRNRAHGGVGLAGMRERLHELGGRLEVDSDGRGTQILAMMPRSERRNSAAVFAAD
ncbi:MAG: sensor histidine kinase [Terriglobales bacterium]